MHSRGHSPGPKSESSYVDVFASYHGGTSLFVSYLSPSVSSADISQADDGELITTSRKRAANDWTRVSPVALQALDLCDREP